MGSSDGAGHGGSVGISRSRRFAAAFASRALGSARDTILATLVRPSDVIRLDLLERMRRSSARLVTVMAPRDTGKTTLLAQRFESIAVPTVWLSIGEIADPTTLFRYLAAALSAVVPMPAALWRELDAARPRSRVMAAHLCAAIEKPPNHSGSSSTTRTSSTTRPASRR